jgi:antitoxin component of RelBE/YafQ-DinJ toxin-antitoxin module
MTIEDATALFLKAVVARKGLPFPLTEEELEEIRKRRKEG